MMENKTFRWIAFAVSAVLAVIAIFAHTFSGFLCFAVAAFIFIPVNRIFEKLDSELDPKYRKRATAITAGIFLVCGLLAFTTAGSHTTSTGRNSGRAAGGKCVHLCHQYRQWNISLSQLFQCEKNFRRKPQRIYRNTR